jgi:hypothetical protein
MKNEQAYIVIDEWYIPIFWGSYFYQTLKQQMWNVEGFISLFSW